MTGETDREWVDLKFAALRAELRLLVVLSVVGNQVLSSVSFHPISAVLGGVAVVAAAFVRYLMIVKQAGGR